MDQKKECPYCKTTLVPTEKKSLFNCSLCGRDFYFNRCWRCGTQIVGSAEDRCGECGWYRCENCTACGPDCLGILAPHRLLPAAGV